MDEANIPGSKYTNTLIEDIEQPETTYSGIARFLMLHQIDELLYMA